MQGCMTANNLGRHPISVSIISPIRMQLHRNSLQHIYCRVPLMRCFYGTILTLTGVRSFICQLPESLVTTCLCWIFLKREGVWSRRQVVGTLPEGRLEERYTH